MYVSFVGLLFIVMLLFFQLLTEFNDDKEILVFFEVFKNVLKSDAEGLKSAIQSQSILYYWQVSQQAPQ